VGGLPVDGGGSIRHGVLYRSDAPYEGDVVSQVDPWPPRLVIDLRSSFEIDVPGAALKSYPWPAMTLMRNIPLLRRAAPSAQHGSLIELYDEMLDSCGPAIANMLNCVVAVAPPTLIHCAAGKDRTGVSVAILLLVAGAEPEAVVADYRRTGPNMPGVLDRVRHSGRHLPRGVPAHLFEAPVEAIRRVTDHMSAHDGGAAGWLIGHGATAAAVETWTERLVARR
jgi:hypothetical protein